MTDQLSFIDNLKHRRVPQILGMYIGATWLVIELGDWVTERFGFPPNLTSFVFVGMLVMLPAVAIFAWNHGAPGKDQWTVFERLFIPSNALAAVAVLYVISPSLTVETATETVQIEDEEGVVQEFEVVRQGFHREVAGFFWDNDSGDASLDWLSYGLPLMLAYDLDRITPVITAMTPFDSPGVRSELRKRGFDTLASAPRGLTVQIARDRRSAAMIVGRFNRDGETKNIDVTVIDVDTGDEIGTHSFSGEGWLVAVDDISAAVQQFLDIAPADETGDDPVSQHFAESIDAVRHFVNGQVALAVANDFATGIAEYQQALELEPAFAEAGRALSTAHYLTGNVDAARGAATEALRSDFRLSETSKFALKANRYMFNGDFVRSMRVLEVWTQVQPNSTTAFSELARISRIRGTDESLEQAMRAYDRLLELDPTDLSVFQQKAEVELQRGNYESAVTMLRNFLDQEPDNGDVLLQLANILQAQGDLDGAQLALEDAAILADDPLQSELGLARLEARRGQYENALARLEDMEASGLDGQQQMMVLSAQSEIAVLRGEIDRAIELVQQTNEIAKSLMPPMLRLFSVESQQAGMLALQGDVDGAISFLDTIGSQLQPPLSNYMAMTYASIYAEAENREASREWIDRLNEASSQMPEIFSPFIEMLNARVAVWEGDAESAVARLDLARQQLAQSFLQTLQNNLSVTAIQVGLAEQYIDADAPDRSLEIVDEVMRVFPGHAQVMMVAAKAHLAKGENARAIQMLDRALDIWADADAAYTHRIEASTLRQGL